MINKDDFITLVASKARFTKGDVAVILDVIISVFEESVLKGESIKIPGFGKLTTTQIPERVGYNAVAGKSEVFPPTKRVNFKLASTIKNPKPTLDRIE